MPTTMSPELWRGRLLVLLAATVTILGDIVVTVVTTPHPSPSKIVVFIVRFFITLALFHAVWRGLRWARWLVVALLALGLCFLFPVLLRTMHPLVIGVALQFAVAVGLLALPPSVSAFLAKQRSLYHENT